MGVHWLGYDVEIIWKVGRNTFVVAVKVNYLAYVETNTADYRVFCIHTRKTYYPHKETLFLSSQGNPIM
jgi:hypothetical protein